MGSEESLKIYSLYPYLVPSSDCKRWEGYLQIQNEEFYLCISTPHYPSIKEIDVECSYKIRFHIMHQKENLLKNETLLNFLQCIVHIIKKKLDMPITKTSLWDTKFINFYKCVNDEIEKNIGRKNVLDTDSCMKWIILKYRDSTDYTHTIKIMLDSKYPKSQLKVCDIDLPDEVLDKFSQVFTLSEMYSTFVTVVDSLTPFWEKIEKFSAMVWVIDPEKPSKKHVHRRILINDHLSLMLTFNPLDSLSFPDIKFLGSVKAAGSATTLYQKNFVDFGWNYDLELIDNLSKLCECPEFPVKPRESDIEETNECFICYDPAPIENEQPPAKWCSNPNCSSFFHLHCLLEWLTSLPNSSNVYEFIYGNCPYCDERILCPLKRDMIS